jgi:hypothetical protein
LSDHRQRSVLLIVSRVCDVSFNEKSISKGEPEEMLVSFLFENKIMNYQESFEDDGFFYTLTIEATEANEEKLYVSSQGKGYRCTWVINSKTGLHENKLMVTDDNCHVLVYQSIEAARSAATRFIFSTEP